MRLLHFPPFLMLVLFAPAAIAWRYMDPAARPPFLIYGIRWFLGILFVISGLAKLIPQFPNTMGPNNLELTLAPYGLALYGRFIAISEVGTGLLLLTRRFATLGALLLVPILVSIIVITTSLQWQGTPYLVSAFLLLAILLLLYDGPKLVGLIGDRPAWSTAAGEQGRRAGHWLAGLSAVLLVLGAIRLESPTAPGVWCALGALILLIVADWRGVRRRG
jgi:uncharacterized membrane protein YphA (DoxX/SURF4 family)